jgi:hypothetical protein
LTLVDNFLTLQHIATTKTVSSSSGEYGWADASDSAACQWNNLGQTQWQKHAQACPSSWLGCQAPEPPIKPLQNPSSRSQAPSSRSQALVKPPGLIIVTYGTHANNFASYSTDPIHPDAEKQTAKCQATPVDHTYMDTHCQGHP